MMKRILFALFLVTLSVATWACPGCAGSDMGKGKPPYTLIVLSIFILLTYIPFYLFYRASKKYDPKNVSDEHI